MNSIKKITIITFSAFMACSLVFCGDALAGKKKKRKEAWDAFDTAMGMLRDGKYEFAARAFNKAGTKYQYDKLDFTGFQKTELTNLNALIYEGRSWFLKASRACENCDKEAKGKIYDLANTAYQKALGMEPDSALVHVLLGNLYYEQDKFDEGVKAVKKGLDLGIKGDGDGLVHDSKLEISAMDAHFFLGELYYFSGKNDLALKEFKRSIGIIDQKINKLSKKAGQFEKDKMTSNASSIDVAAAGFARHKFEEAKNKYRKFDRCYASGGMDQCMGIPEWQHVRRYRGAHWFLGNAYKRKGDYGKARQNYKYAAAMGVSLGAKYLADLDLDVCKDLAKKNKDKALPVMTQEVRKYLIQGQALRKAEKYGEAIEKLNKVVEIEPLTSAVYYNLGLIEGAKKNYLPAMNRMKCFLELDPNHAKAQKAQDKIYEWEAFVK
ncbi:tetratricopeptide repeat protein [Elusimicrobiota bacterium]